MFRKKAVSQDLALINEDKNTIYWNVHQGHIQHDDNSLNLKKIKKILKLKMYRVYLKKVNKL